MWPVKLSISERRIHKVAAQYGVSRAALYNWKQRLLGKNGVVPMSKKADPVEQSRGKESFEAEIADLQQQIHRLRMERDALEKAAELLKSGRHQSDLSGKPRKSRGD